MDGPKLYRTKPSVIEAIQWDGSQLASRVIGVFAKGKVHWTSHNSLELLAGKDGAQGWVPVPLDHWVVRSPGDDTDYWPVDDTYFKNKYEPVEGPQS